MNEIEDHRRAGDLVKSLCVPLGGGLQIRRFHEHGMDLLGPERDGIKQAGLQMGEISIRVARGSHPLVHLNYVHSLPGNCFACQRTQHDPRSAPATYGHDEAAPQFGRRTRIRSDESRSPSRNRFSISEYFNFQGRSPIPDLAFKFIPTARDASLKIS
jgi:hypothetical protein